MKILIAVPTFETIQPEVFKAIYDLKKPDGVEVYFDFVKGYDCAVARNKIGVLAKDGYDYVLMVDSDTIIPPDTLDIMLTDPVDICLGVCPRKNTKTGETAMIKFDEPDYKNSWHYSELPAERTKIKGGGFACAFIKSYVFTYLDYPYFQYVTNADCSTFSEDFYFCSNARLMGYDIWMEPRVKCGHLARYYQYE